MNPPQLFRSLLAIVEANTTDEVIEHFIERIREQLDDYPRCLALLRPGDVRIEFFYGLAQIFPTQGVQLRVRQRQKGDGLYVFAEKLEDEPAQRREPRVHLEVHAESQNLSY